jgi:transposase-like protein
MANHKYPAEYRAHAVEPWRTSGKSQRAVWLELGISNELLRRWVRQDDLDKVCVATVRRRPSARSCACCRPK